MRCEVQKHIGLIEKTKERKTMMQSSSSSNCICIYSIKILNPFDQELRLNNTKLIIKNRLKTS